MAVLLYIPNIIIYLRVILLGIGMLLWFKSGFATFTLIAISAQLDSLDGYIARKLNQSSKTGALFDFTLDRITTCCYLMGVTLMYPKYWLVFLSILVLDLSSHFSHLYAFGFSNTTSHKNTRTSQSRLFRLYYSNQPFLWFCCFSYDMTFAAFYLIYWFHFPLIQLSFILFVPGFLIKNYIHWVQLKGAIQTTLALDFDEAQTHAPKEQVVNA